ncbi:MAG TPA: polysaccharide deacetylase family protein [Polyangiaceae bacterium]|nr:polysaccharide deacetylase family protein [Polyangiaceae bacterium]
MPVARLLLYAATAGGFALAVKAVAFEPPPLWVACLALFAYVGLVTLGVVFSRFSMFADVITLGPQHARGVALTFDDGPDPRTTPKILDLLESAGASATFFIIGSKAEAHPDIVRDIHARGHAIGIHSYAHERLLSLKGPWHVRADLERAARLLANITGKRPLLFRPPIGHISPSMARVVRDMDLVVIGWSARAVDGWSGAKSDHVAERVIRKLRDGTFVLLHDAAERGDFIPASVQALPRILEAAREKNLPLVRVDRWLGEGTAAELSEAHDEIA